MIPLLQPFRVLAVILAGWSNRHQLRVIEYLLEETESLQSRTHLAFNGNSPVARGIEIGDRVVSTAVLGELHHRHWAVT